MWTQGTCGSALRSLSERVAGLELKRGCSSLEFSRSDKFLLRRYNRPLMGGYHIAVVGATGAAGTELLRVLERRSFPVASLRPIGSARSIGKSVQFCGESVAVEKLDAGSFEKTDIVFFSAGGDISRKYVPIACQ